MAIPSDPGSEALHRLKATDPPQWLAPSAALSQTARAASQHLFSSLRSYAPKSPFDQLLVEGFDAEQIWQQIDLQSQPLLSSLDRELKRFAKDPAEIRKLRVFGEDEDKKKGGEEEVEKMEVESDGFGEDLEESDEEEEEEQEENEIEDEDEDEDEEAKDGNGDGGIEDRFLKIKELEEFLEEDEAREYGLKKKVVDEDQDEASEEEEEEEGDEDEEDEDEDGDEIGGFGLGDDEEEEADKFGNARYEDFFGGKKKTTSKRKSKLVGDSEDSGTDDDNEKQKTLSTHEKELAKLQSKIEQMEKLNLEPKTWTMQGEVTAAKRPKNSALEVDLDFEHNVRPPPVITEDVTASLEDMIKKRIMEGHFDDVEKPPALPSKAPREVKELDENKSKKGLAEIYEEEYVQKTNLASAPLSFAEEEKKEASMLFKKLCLKLDALSHFHFTPKPVIEDMSIQANVPALAMEEIAPVAVSDAAMLAPEEVFVGKGDVKEESELTQADRKRRRANKKRKFKAEATKRAGNKPLDGTLLHNSDAEITKRITKKVRE